MIISFDIDDTLISVDPKFAREKYTIVCKLAGAEKLRKGTIKLFNELKASGHEIYIYTTSHRSRFSLRKTFFAHGLKPKRFISGVENREALSVANCSASKNPHLFNIDLHIDDLPGVKMEADRYNFKALIIDLYDEKWTEKIWKAINEQAEKKL